MSNESKCPKCKNTAFEVVNEKPVNSNYNLILVRCTECKVVVGALDYYNVGALVRKLAEKMHIDLDD